MDNIALLNLEGMGMAGFPGVAARLFGALHRLGISVILISQARSHVPGYTVSMLSLQDACKMETTNEPSNSICALDVVYLVDSFVRAVLKKV